MDLNGVWRFSKRPNNFYFYNSSAHSFFNYTKKNFFNLIWTNIGFLIFLLISIPWFVLISIKSNGLFWHESVINDLFNKVKSGQESHGFLPGYYTLLHFFVFLAWINIFTSFLINVKKNLKNIFFKII